MNPFTAQLADQRIRDLHRAADRVRIVRGARPPRRRTRSAR
jgi:hypothetical protein